MSVAKVVAFDQYKSKNLFCIQLSKQVFWLERLDLYSKLIIEEGGVRHLLKLIKGEKIDGQKNAARTIGLLGRDPESVEHIIQTSVYSMFEKILKECPIKVQAISKKK